MASTEKIASAPGRTVSSEQLRMDILDAAAALFSRRGFQGTSTQELADAVGLVKATLYYHIDSKEELLFKVAMTVVEARIAAWQTVMAGEHRSASARLTRLIEAHCAMLPIHRESFIVVSDELKHLPPHRLEQILARRAVADRLLRDVIEQGHDSGEFRVPDAEAAALVVMGMLNSMTRWYRPRGRLKADQIVAQVSSIVLQGVGAPSTSRASRHSDTRRPSALQR